MYKIKGTVVHTVRDLFNTTPRLKDENETLNYIRKISVSEPKKHGSPGAGGGGRCGIILHEQHMKFNGIITNM